MPHPCPHPRPKTPPQPWGFGPEETDKEVPRTHPPHTLAPAPLAGDTTPCRMTAVTLQSLRASYMGLRPQSSPHPSRAWKRRFDSDPKAGVPPLPPKSVTRNPTPIAPAQTPKPFTVRFPGRTPGACILHAYVTVFPCHVQPLQGGHVTKHRSSLTRALNPEAGTVKPGPAISNTVGTI